MRRILWNEVSGGRAYHAAYVTLRQPEQTTLHDHDFAEAFWIVAGAAVHRIGDARIRTRAGDLWLIRPHDAHAIEAARAVQFINIAFSLNALELACELADAQDAYREWCSADKPLSISNLAFEGAFRRALSGAMGDDLGLYRYQFLGELVRLLHPPARPGFEAAGPAWLIAAVSQFRDDDALRGGLPRLRTVAGVSDEHLARVFRAVYGQSPSEFVLRRRLERAYGLLRSSQLSVAEIAAIVGFRYEGHFFRAFRARFQMSPREARRAAAAQVLGET
ncbi:MAG: AraC family transcriptional regulator [Fimbriimonadaceae bacterium]|nr:AraC family transcriptional regulator [Fimbriimonadaceae bacterium]